MQWQVARVISRDVGQVGLAWAEQMPTVIANAGDERLGKAAFILMYCCR